MPDARPIWHTKSDTKGGFNLVGYSNHIVDKNIELSEKTTDMKILSKLYKEIFYEISNDLPYIFLYIPRISEPVDTIVIKNNVFTLYVITT